MNNDRFDPWRTLGVPIGAGPDEIRRAWRKLARRNHPDVRRDEGAHEQFIRLRQAYETLIDDNLRARLEQQALSEDTEPLVIVQDFDVVLGDAYQLLEGDYLEEARDLYLELAREYAGDPRLLELLDAIHRAEDRAVAAELGAHDNSRIPIIQPAGSRPASSPLGRERHHEIWTPRPTPVRWWLPALGLLIVGGCIAIARTGAGEPILSGMSLLEIAMAALAGFLGTALAAAGGLLRSFDTELGASVSDQRAEVPLWVYLGAAGLVSPALALIFYVIFVALQVQFSWRVLGFFATSFGVAALLAWTQGGNWAMIILLGSRAVFAPGLLGWAVGSIFRPGQWWE